MAHVHAYGDACPQARPIIHLGATSCYVTDNTDLILLREALRIVRDQTAAVIDALARFAERHMALPCLGFTHFQPAQPTRWASGPASGPTIWSSTWARSSTAWRELKSQGVKGTTGTQASFLELFGGDHAKVEALDRMVAEAIGFAESYPVTGQTYSRKIDAQVLAVLAGIGRERHSFGTDLRLLAHSARSRSRSRRSRSAPRRWPTSATRCAASGSARWRGSSWPAAGRRPDRGDAVAGAHAGRQRQPAARRCRRRSWPSTRC